jgi:hypothetical protein
VIALAPVLSTNPARTESDNLYAANQLPSKNTAPFKTNDAVVSVFVSDSTFAFGSTLLNTWLPPQSSIIVNDGDSPENFSGRISQFTAGANHWEISSVKNGIDSISAQWSAISSSGPWNDIDNYDSDFIIATNVSTSDTITIWFRIETPTHTTSFEQYISTMTVSAVQF